jgi:hypothetical protein
MIFYYDVEGNVYPNKYEAIKSGKNLLLYFYDKEFSFVNWKIEPVETLPELYRQRAQQLRDMYEYLILCYSGGADSTNILETFYYNGIHLDEILTVGALSQDTHSGSDENHNGELYHNVFPTLASMDLPNTKVTVFDYSTLFDDLKNFSVASDTDWAKNTVTHFSPHNWFWRDIRKWVGPKDRKTAIIMGIDKPSLVPDPNTGVIGFRFNDQSIFSYGRTLESISVDNSDIINFYWDTSTSNLISKQHHVLKNFYIDNVMVKKLISNEQFAFHMRQVVTKIIYDLKNPLIHVSPKSPSQLLSLRDNFLSKRHSTVADFHKHSLNKLADIGFSTASIKSRIYEL